MQLKPILLLALFFSAVVFVVAKRKLGRYARNTYDPFKERIGAPCEPGEDSPLNCPAGTSCLRGACNCDDLPDGTIMSISHFKDGRKCKRIAGQKCKSSTECFWGVSCLKGKCTCPRDPGFECVKKKIVKEIPD